MFRAIIPGALLAAGALQAQQTKPPPLSPADLAPFTHYFDVVDGKLAGEGAVFLAAELGKPRFVLLGEYHGSLRISEFTEAIIPVLHQAGHRTMALEIGPQSVGILRELARDPASTEARLHHFNTKYLVPSQRRDFTPIPFFSNVEDARFLATATSRGWQLYGLDQEFSFGYVSLLDRMHGNLSPARQRDLADLHARVTNEVQALYRADLAPGADRSGGKDMYSRMGQSPDLSEFLRRASEGVPANQAIAEAIRATTEIYRLNATRKYWDNNGTRIRYMKANLRASMTSSGFDPAKDRLLLKMGAVHTGRGLSPLRFYELGNTLSELAELDGGTSLHVTFGTRFHVEDGKEVDALADTSTYLARFAGLAQMGRRDQWTVIDLRPLREALFYHERFSVHDRVREVFERHDLYVIPKLEQDPTPNFTAPARAGTR